MIIKLLTSVALATVGLDITIGIAWWITKQVTYKAASTVSNGITYMIMAA